MNAMTIIPSNDVVPSDFESWVETGRGLIQKRRQLDWKIADWLVEGKQYFPPEQIEMALSELADVASDDARVFRKVEKVAQAFPPHLRNESLSFEHHAKVADMPVQEALPLLKRASAEHMTPARLRIEAMLRKIDIGQVLPREDDPEDDALLACVRAWNRAPRSVREEFAEMIAESDLGVIEP